VLEKLEKAPAVQSSPPRTLNRLIDLDLSLLSSCLPDGTELCKADRVLHTELQKVTGLLSSIKRYIGRTTWAIVIVLFKYLEGILIESSLDK
jgi:hypothetical protein